jgi:stage V sporulation protein R
LVHRHEGLDLDVPFAQETLRALYTLWKRPVHIETMVAGKKVLWSHDGAGAVQSTLT